MPTHELSCPVVTSDSGVVRWQSQSGRAAETSVGKTFKLINTKTQCTLYCVRRYLCECGVDSKLLKPALLYRNTGIDLLQLSRTMSSRVRTTNEVDSQSKFRPTDGRRTAAFSNGRSGWRKTAAKVRLGQVVTQPQPVVDQHSTSTERLARASFNRHENRSGATSAGDYRLEAHTDHPSSSVVVLRRASPGLLLLDTNTRIAESVRDKDIPVDSRHAETVTADDNKSRKKKKKKKKNLVKLAPLWLWTRPWASLWW